MKRFFLFSLFAFAMTSNGVSQSPAPTLTDTDPRTESLAYLDTNQDGILDPYEVLDRLLELETEKGSALTVQDAIVLLNQQRQSDSEEVAEILSQLDKNQDGKTELSEIDGPMRDYAASRDLNQDGVITLQEAMTEPASEEPESLSDAEILQEVNELLSELDKNHDDQLTRKEADDPALWAELQEADSDQDQCISKAELVAFITSMSECEQPASFEVVGDSAVMTGVIGAGTPSQVLRLVFEHPAIRTIEMADVPGSMDDEANLRAARYVRKFGFTTRLRSNHQVASGGTDFFLAGKTRIIESGAKLGIHSWGGPGFEGKDIPKDDPQHQLYLEYYREMGTPAEFYWRTLEAAPASGIHWMTEEELTQFKFRTASPNPNDSPSSQTEPPSPPATKLEDAIGVTRISKLPQDFPKKYRKSFDRYVQLIAPNGKPISIFAQKEITDAQVRHVRDVMLHYLTDFPGSQFGSCKKEVANRMADNRAMMVILKGSDGEFREPRIAAQPLYQTETIVEGTAAYVNNDFENHRDATLEEILHCVHDQGIGVDFPRSPSGVLPEFQKQIRAATTHAMNNGIWPTESSDEQTANWIEELRDEGSLTQEYLASVIDSYYGLWGPFDEPFGMWGVYIARTRSDIRTKDPQGLAAVEAFFHPFLTYQAEIDPAFSGTFSLKFDEQTPYTHKSRYLLHAKLTGTSNSNLTGNSQDNRLQGNSGNNVLDGGDGKDTVVFPHPESHYVVEKMKDGTIRVTGDGTDTLINIEHLVFDGLKSDNRRFVPTVPPRFPR